MVDKLNERLLAPESFLVFLNFWIQKFTHLGGLWSVGLDYADQKKNNDYTGKIVLVISLTAMCILVLKQSPTFDTPSVVLLLLMMFLIQYLISY